MAFTKTPMDNTEQTKTVQLLYQWDTRNDSSGNYDTILKNALFEQIDQQNYHMYKRNGTEQVALSAQPPTSCLGIYYWKRAFTTSVIVVVCTNFINVYDANTLALSSSTGVSGLNKGDWEVDFSEFLYQSGAVDLFIAANGGLYRVDSSLAVTGPITTTVVNPKPSVVFLDGYLFITDGTNIWNSNLNDPLTWSASNFLAVDAYSDNVDRIARAGPYIVAFGSESIQYFYDAANPTGTPLGANVGATKHIGYLSGIAKKGDDIYFIGTASNSTQMLYKLSGLKVEDVASFPFSRFWQSQGSMYSVIDAGGSILSLNGHNCYYVRTSSTPFPVGTTPPNPLLGSSYIYDLDSKMWSKLGYQATESYLIKGATTFSNVAGSPRMTYIVVLGDNKVYRFSPTIYQDNGVNFEVKFQTPKMDFDTRRIKFGARLLITGDQTATSSLASVSWSDDDYKTFSTPRTVDMQYAYQQLYSLGSFRARSFVMTYSDNFPMRWNSIELDYLQGQA